MAAQVGAELAHESAAPAVLALSPDDDARARCLRLAVGGADLAWSRGRDRRSPRRQSRDATMQITPKVKEILSWYEGENPGVKGNLARLLMHGRLAGSGKLVILPVDQGYEHGPARSFAANPPAYDPHYLYQLALDAGLSGYAAPLGLLEQGADTYAGQLPTILKMNSANSLAADGARPGGDRLGQGRAPARLRRRRLHDLPGLGRLLRHDGGDPRHHPRGQVATG